MAKLLAVIIFLAMFVLIILDKFERQNITLICGALVLVLVFGLCMHDPGAIWRTLNLQGIVQKSFWYTGGTSGEETTGINWSTIFFIVGMMVMVEGMANAGFFRWLCLRLAKAVHYRIVPIFMVFMVMSFVLSMFIDSITVILFLAAVSVELSQLLKFNPVPVILSEIFCANLGGSATMCGDPPNIIIGTSLGYTFGDFISNTGVIAVISLAATLVYFYLVFRKELSRSEGKGDVSNYPDPRDAIKSRSGFAISTVIFLCAVVLLTTHAQTGLTVASIGVGIAVITLITSGKDIIKVIKGVDFKTALFFVGLFVVVCGLEETGVLVIIANFISRISGGNEALMIVIILWISALCSAFIDNIPFAATMIPVIKSLAAVNGVPLSTLAWALSIGTDIGGSGTPIGASANVVGTAVAAKSGHPVGWKEYCTAAVPATALVLLISTLYLFARYL